MFVYVFLYVIMIEKIYFYDRWKYDWYYGSVYLNSLVCEYVLWNVILKADCVCYNDKRIDWYRALVGLKYDRVIGRALLVASNTMGCMGGDALVVFKSGWYMGCALRCFQIGFYTLLTQLLASTEKFASLLNECCEETCDLLDRHLLQEIEQIRSLLRKFSNNMALLAPLARLLQFSAIIMHYLARTCEKLPRISQVLSHRLTKASNFS